MIYSQESDLQFIPLVMKLRSEKKMIPFYKIDHTGHKKKTLTYNYVCLIVLFHRYQHV